MSPYIRPILFPREGLCYLENAKCGSSSILDAVGGERVSDDGLNRQEARLRVVRSLDTIDARNLPARLKHRLVRRGDNRLIVSFVRNPYTRFLSAYLGLVRNPQRFPLQRLEAFGRRGDVSFMEFAALAAEQDSGEMNFHWRPQADLLDPECVEFDFIGRVERFEHDLQALRSYSDDGQLPTERGLEHRTGAAERVHEYYTEEIRRLVYQRYQDDFRLFGYDASLDYIGEYDDSVLPAAWEQPRSTVVRSVGWKYAAELARVVNTIQRTPIWKAAWAGRRAVARARARLWYQ